MRVLLIDTCGEVGSVALANNDLIFASRNLPDRAVSASLLRAVAEVLEEAMWDMQQIDAVGVVSGPGSFTGVRVGLAAAKGFCEVGMLPLAPVSRLEVLADASTHDICFAALDAGRGEVYIRSPDGREVLMRLDELTTILTEKAPVVVAEKRMLSLLEQIDPELREIDSKHALPAVLRSLNSGVGDAALVDANYVRSEQDIYPRKRSKPQ